MFVVLLVVGAPLAERQHSTSMPTESSRHTIVAGETPMAPTAVSSTEQSRRFLSLGALVAYLAVTTSVALALRLGIRSGIASWVLLPRTGLTRRERAPPFVRA
jgi:predicted lysophospholipase L1 biosynthesis ABC-type transport system permease subunit